jgi:hypothetical protein
MYQSSVFNSIYPTRSFTKAAVTITSTTSDHWFASKYIASISHKKNSNLVG